MDSVKIQSGNTKMIAHRGLSGIEKENSNPAFVAAANRSYFGIETDVHLTADGKYIIIHDDNTERVTGENHIVEKTDFGTLRQLHLIDEVSKDLKLPTLEEYIKICAKYNKAAVLEIKNAMPEKNIAEIIDIIDMVGYLDNTIIISFAISNLESVRNIRKNQQVQFLCDMYDQTMLNKLISSEMDIDIFYNSATKELIDIMHTNGRKVNCWTCDNKADAEKLISYGVDYITTNILE